MKAEEDATVQDLFINVDNGNTIIHLENFEVLNG